MKSKFFNKVFLFLLISTVYFAGFSGFKEFTEIKIVPVSYPVNINDFFMYMIASGYQDTSLVDKVHTYWNMNYHLTYYKELNFNGAHMYHSDSDSLGDFDENVLTDKQVLRVDNLADLAGENSMQRIFDRNRISRLCFAQRLIYEVNNNNSATEHYGFCYKNCMSGTFTNDSGRTVLHANAGTHNAGWFAKDIFENMQHTDLYYFAGTGDLETWYLKPVMRIKKNDFDVEDTTSVVRIDAVNFSGDIVKSLNIRVKNFGKDGINYDGSYSSIYNFVNDAQNNSQVSGNKTNGLNKGYLTGNSADSSKVDFRVYWYGLVDVWFDKMIVDDEDANHLFNGDFDQKIKDEVTKFGDEVLFSADEIVSSNAYTTKYVIDKMKEYNPDSKLIYAISSNLNIFCHRNDNLGSKMLLDITKPDIVAIDAHSLQNNGGGYVPDNFLNYDARIPAGWKRTAPVYNSFLQQQAFGNKNELVINYEGTYLYQIYEVKKEIDSMNLSTKIIIQPQIQGWMPQVRGSSEFSTQNFREPTNEEIEAQAGIAIAHGADGINWFIYSSWISEGHNSEYNDNPLANTDYYVFGLRNRYGDPHGNFSKREENIYGQDKWNYVKNMNRKIMNWKPVLDKTIWTGGYSVHYEGANHEFISDIQSLCCKSQPEYEYKEFNMDAVNERYWEMGFYAPDPSFQNYPANDKSKYFVIVNRRCYPEKPGVDDGLRELRIKFNGTELSNFNNWKIINVNTGSEVITIDKNSTGFYNFGEFKPGEAKMYEITPVN